MNKHKSHQRDTGRKVTGALLLLLFVLSGSGLLTVFLAAGAQLGGQHRVTLVPSGDSLRLVLSHDEADTHPAPTLLPRHRHSALSDLVAAFSNRRSGDEDHVIRVVRSPLTTGDGRERSEIHPEIAKIVASPAAVRPAVCVLRVSVRPAPASAGLHLRTIVLLV